jgi:hypothetical protein
VANLSIHVDQLTAELLEFAKLGDLTLGFVDGGWVGERFGNGLALNLGGQAEIGTVARLVGLMAAAVEFATTAFGGSDGAAAEVLQLDDQFDDLGALLLQGF